MKIHPQLAGALGLLVFGVPVSAQVSPHDGKQGQGGEISVFDGDYMTIGVGAAYGPSYAGSDDYVAYPAAIIIGSIGGVDFQTKGTTLDVDLVPRTADTKVDFIFGPSVKLRIDRSSQIKDPIVKAVGKLDKSLELGIDGGVQVNRVFNPYDSLVFDVELRWSVSGAKNGQILTPTLSYFTPLSRAMAMTLAVSAEHGDSDFTDYYYGVSPVQSAASAGALPVFKPGGGWKSAGANLLFGYDWDRDLSNGGLGLFAVGGYSRMMGDARKSPFTALRGKADQWLAVAGVGYTF